MMSVKIQHLTKAYPNFLLNDVSFQLEEGTIMGLIGKNGAGKSTIIKSMIHMINPDKGALIFWGAGYYGKRAGDQGKFRYSYWWNGYLSHENNQANLHSD